MRRWRALDFGNGVSEANPQRAIHQQQNPIEVCDPPFLQPNFPSAISPMSPAGSRCDNHSSFPFCVYPPNIICILGRRVEPSTPRVPRGGKAIPSSGRASLASTNLPKPQFRPWARSFFVARSAGGMAATSTLNMADVPVAVPAAVPPAPVACLICDRTVFCPKLRLPCGHVHCPACIRANFRVTMRSAPFQPVRCCERIDVAVLRWVASLSVTMGPAMDVTSYRQRLTEFDTPEKLYCWNPKCGTFIPPALRAGNDRFGHSALCRKCKTKTCTRCKAKFHFGACTAPRATGEPVGRPKRTNDELFRMLSVKKKWKACPSCKAVVEKIDGCNHISCMCGTHWCYRCGKAPYDNHGPCAM
ncbi:hypothetical protein B0T16DRAFT_14890 [Cercophora newfieldiana]|uniref:RBR-type E3 ubiquitin transferase n=1 Tax=Cercophora newfieldiana TaxID=92897 RepID=A0AA40D097_9PEZI|nr:hypothetical protein B0T16DRAFT_14890 [Cercophora newfieldiana]